MDCTEEWLIEFGIVIRHERGGKCQIFSEILVHPAIDRADDHHVNFYRHFLLP